MFADHWLRNSILMALVSTGKGATAPPKLKLGHDKMHANPRSFFKKGVGVDAKLQ